MIDTSQTVEVKGSPSKLAWLSVLGVIMTGLCAWMAFGGIAELEPGSFKHVVVSFGAVFFGFCTALAFHRLFNAGRAVVTFAPAGFRDTRLAREPIPWSVIADIESVTYMGQPLMMFSVPPEVERGLGLSPIARMSRGPNRALGFDGLFVTAQGLAIPHDRLIELARAYAAASRAVRPS